MKLNGPRQFVVYADDNNSFRDNVNTIHRNREALTDASKEFGLEVGHRSNMARQLFTVSA
jgi:hypothetical protein